ncbi:heparin lyase I family protein [Fibrobacterota bacterium]
MVFLLIAFTIGLVQADLVYKCDFEDGSLRPEIGSANQETQGTTISNEENPLPTILNTSDRAGFCRVPPSGRRAEFSTQRVTTNNRTYVYKWSYFIPEDFFTDAEIGWLLISQWKTWPCEIGGSNGPDICYSGGIFNEVDLHQETRKISFRYRAQPDCRRVDVDCILGEWMDFQQEIYWTNNSDGYFKLWMNGHLIQEEQNIKTLFDNFDQGGCDIYWAIGAYTSWNGTKDFIGLYIDDMEIWDTSGVVGIIGEDDYPVSIISPGKSSGKQAVLTGYQLSYRPDLWWENLRFIDVSGRRVQIPQAQEKTPFRLPGGVYIKQKDTGMDKKNNPEESEGNQEY